MFCEKLLSIGAKIKQVNTDGVLYLIKKEKLTELERITKEWEEQTKLTFELEEFEAFYQFAINDYLAVGKGYSETHNPKLLKKKGLFIDSVTLGKGMQPMIIPKAINAYFTEGKSLTETIRGCTDITQFLTYQKVGKQFSVEYNGKLISRINRYYMSIGTPSLLKCKVDANGKRSGYINLVSTSGVTILNNLAECKSFPNNINYEYYIREAEKIIEPIIYQQLTLF